MILIYNKLRNYEITNNRFFNESLENLEEYPLLNMEVVICEYE